MTDEELAALNERVASAEKRATALATELHSLASQTGNISTEIEHVGQKDIASRLLGIAQAANKAALT